MRILMLAQFYPPSLGGEEQHVRNLAAGLFERGHSVAVATLRQTGLPSVEDDGGVRVYRITGTSQRLAGLYSAGDHRFAPPLPDPGSVLALRRVIDLEKPDIVHAHNWLVHSFLPLKHRSRAKLVLTLHDYSLVCSQKRLSYREAVCNGPEFSKCQRCARHHYGPIKGTATATALQLMRPIEQRAVDHFIAVSNAVVAGNELQRLGVSHEVIPNFVPDDVPVRPAVDHLSLGTLPDQPFILYVGDLSRDKGVPILLRAYEGLPDTKPPLVLIGKRVADSPSLWPAGTTVIDRLPHDVVMSVWRRALFAVAPSVWPDPCPTVAMEAMSCGLPVIAARSGGLPDIVENGVCGLVVEPGDAEELRSATARLLYDDTLRAQLARGALEGVKAFHASRVIPRIEAAYERLAYAGSRAVISTRS